MQVTLHDNDDLRAVVRALGKAANGKELKTQLRKELRRELAPMVADVKQAWRSAPSGRGSVRRRGGSLRGSLARATRGEVRTSGREAGVRVRTDGRRMPNQAKSLPTLAEGTKRPWRHPVHGDRDVWVQQRPFPRFYRAVRPNEAAARREVERAVETVFRQIVRAR